MNKEPVRNHSCSKLAGRHQRITYLLNMPMLNLLQKCYPNAPFLRQPLLRFEYEIPNKAGILQEWTEDTINTCVQVWHKKRCVTCSCEDKSLCSVFSFGSLRVLCGSWRTIKWATNHFFIKTSLKALIVISLLEQQHEGSCASSF